MSSRSDPFARSLDPNEVNVFIVTEGLENAHRIRSTTYAREHSRRQVSSSGESFCNIAM